MSQVPSPKFSSINRLFAAAAFALMAGAASSAQAEDRGFMAFFEDPAQPAEDMSAYYGGQQEQRQQQAYYSGQPDEQDQRLGREYPTTTKEVVSDPTNERAGTITVDTGNRYLYLSLGGGEAVRYGIGVGRQGFTWKGRVHIGRKESWPAWTPPSTPTARRCAAVTSPAPLRWRTCRVCGSRSRRAR